MNFTIKEIENRRDLRRFIYLPARLHQGRPNWVPPIYMDEWSYFSPRKNPSFTHCDTIRLLAYEGKKAVGRIMGIINRRYNEIRGEKTARFGYLETEHNEDLVEALVGHVESWAKSKGMNRVVGPYGFSDQDPEGFLIEGFENRATVATYYNFEWMPTLIERLGYKKEIDYFVYRIEIPRELPEFYAKIYERITRKGRYELIEFRKKKELKPYIKPVLRLMNECYTDSNIYGYAPLSEKEMEGLAKRYLPILDPQFVKAVKDKDLLVAFIIGMPDMTKGIQKARGRLLPFGFLKILRAAKKTKQLDLLLGAIKEEYRGRGIDVMMGVKTIMSAWEAGYQVVDTHHEMETNTRVRAEMERMGGKVYKKFRIYQKQL